MSGVVTDLLTNINDVLGVRDGIGAALKVVKIVTKTWSGAELGLGTATTTEVNVTPSPYVVEFSAASKILQGGVVKQGDIILKSISKQTFPTENLVDCVAATKNVEKYYDVGGIKYQVIHVRERHVTWEVHLRRRSSQS